MSGRILNLTREEYDAHPGENYSRLKHLAKSPAHYLHAKTAKQEDSDAFRLGRILHIVLLEPENIAAKVAVAPDVDRRTKAGKADWAKFEAESKGKEITTAEELEQAHDMAAAVIAQPKITVYLKGQREVSIEWHAGERLCKSRLDVIADAGMVLDPKTTRCAEREKFGRDAFSLGYLTQAAFYVDAVKAATGETMPFGLLAMEKEPPYCSALYVLTEDQLAHGRAEYQRLLALLDECERTSTWPGYPPVDFLHTPDWTGLSSEE